jgi:two-component system, NtrC family, sensor kinase
MRDEARATILVVDDREENRYIVSRTLLAAGYSVVQARTGQEALAKAGDLPDLVLLDIRLPDMTGYEVCNRIKANPTTRGIPVVHLSASFITSESRVMSLEGGADSYLTQPVEPPVLLATVKALLRLRKAEAMSRLSARQWQVTFDSLSEAIGLLDEQGRIQRCNRAMSELTGRRYSEIEGKTLAEVLAESLRIDLPVSAGDMLRSRVEVETPDQRWFVISTDQIVDQDGMPSGNIFVVSDVTDSKRAQEALKLSERLAATGRLAHSIAHEINNPLEAVVNLLYLMDHSSDVAEVKSYIAQATAEIARVSRITKHTLAFHREAPSPIDLNVGELVDSVVSLYGPQLASRNISIRRQYDDNTAIVGLPSALQQAIANFLSNAIDASKPGGEITLRISQSREWRNSQRDGVRILVADHGRGIPSEVRKRIFDAFFTTKGTKGSGLGLWLSLGIVHKHGGHVHLRSSIVPARSGTCFSIFLPCQPPLAQEPATNKAS